MPNTSEPVFVSAVRRLLDDGNEQQTQEFLDSYSQAVAESDYPTEDCLRAWEMEQAIAAALSAERQEHVAACTYCGPLIGMATPTIEQLAQFRETLSDELQRLPILNSSFNFVVLADPESVELGNIDSVSQALRGFECLSMLVTPSLIAGFAEAGSAVAAAISLAKSGSGIRDWSDVFVGARADFDEPASVGRHCVRLPAVSEYLAASLVVSPLVASVCGREVLELSLGRELPEYQDATLLFAGGASPDASDN